MLTSTKKLCGILVMVAAFTLQARAQIVIGTGDSTANLVIQATAFGSTALWYQYLYNASDYTAEQPLSGADVLIAVSGEAESGLTINYTGTPQAGTFFLSSITYNSFTLTSYVDENSWTYFTAGGTVSVLDEYYDPVYEDGIPVVQAVAEGAWQLASVGSSVRYVADGSWDGWVFGPWEYDPVTWDATYEGSEPSIAPVPEPGTVWLVVAGLAALVVIRRRMVEVSREGGSQEKGIYAR